MEGAYFGGANGGWTEPSNEVRGTEGISDTLIKTIHRHTMSVGIDMQHQRAVEDAANYPADAIIGFGGGYTGNGVADWLLGYMSSFEQGAGELADIQGWQVDPYVNDEFRVKPGLTLTLGLRWDPDLRAGFCRRPRVRLSWQGSRASSSPQRQPAWSFPATAAWTTRFAPAARISSSRASEWPTSRQNMPHTSFHAAFGLFSGPVPYSDYNHVVDIAPFAPALAPAAPSNVPICSTGGSTAACAPNTGQAVAGYDNFHNPWATSSFGTNGVSPFPPFATVDLQAAIELADSRPGLCAGFLLPELQGRHDSGLERLGRAAAEQCDGMRVAYVGSESYHQSYVQDDNFAGYSYCTSYTIATCPTPANWPRRLLLRTPISAASWNTTAAPPPTITLCRLRSSGIWRMVSRRSPALPGRRPWTWPVPPTSPPARTGSTIPGTCAGAAASPVRVFLSPGSPTLFTALRNCVGRNLLMREALGGWELSPIAHLAVGRAVQHRLAAAARLPMASPATAAAACSSAAAIAPTASRECRSRFARAGGRSWTKQYFNPAAFVSPSRRHIRQQRPRYHAQPAGLQRRRGADEELVHPGTVSAAVPLRVLQRLQPPGHGQSGHVSDGLHLWPNQRRPAALTANVLRALARLL